MKIAEIVIFIILFVVIGNLLFQSIYCRIMRYIDKKKIVYEVSKNDKIRKSDSINLQSENIKIKILLSKFKYFIYYLLEHYFYGLMRYSIINCGKIPSHTVRYIIYKHIFAMKITKKTVINGGCEFRSPWNIEAGRCIIMSNCILDGRGGIKIEEDVVFGNGVHIWTEEHDVNDSYFKVNPKNRGPVIIKKHAWICSDSTILSRITIGEGAVVAARACITSDCEDYGIYGGVPAKKIGIRNNDLRYVLNGKPHWNFY